MRSRGLPPLNRLKSCPGTAAPGESADAAADDISWRYKQYNGRWWYWLPSKRWVFWHEGRWVDYDPATFSQYQARPSRSGMRYRSGPSYQANSGYDSRYRRDYYLDRRDLLNPPVDRGVGSYYGRYYPFYPYYSGYVGGIGWGPYGGYYGSGFGAGGYYSGSVGFGVGGRW